MSDLQAMVERPRMKIDKREIGRARGDRPGPTLVIVAGVHGNEPAGILAARRVFARLERGGVDISGDLRVFAGNLAALRLGVRYQVKDLNRAWSEDRVALVKGDCTLDAEDREQLELVSAIEEAILEARGPLHMGDFHTSSAHGIPFVLFGDTLPQRAFVQAFPIPVVMGLEEQVDGVQSAYWTRRGFVTFAVEGGQHDDPGSVDNLEAVLWIAMAQAGLIGEGSIPELGKSRGVLEEKRQDIPRLLEVVSRHAITEADAFEMAPGFRCLDHARKGQLLARDRTGAIHAKTDGMVILPLYQGLGSDGFFWGRKVSQARLTASSALRHMRLDRLLHLLPGVTRDPGNASRFVVDTHVAKLYPLDVFHVFGYRRVREDGDKLTVERQPG